MATNTPTRQPKGMRLLVLNPNSSADMTRTMEQAVRSMDLPDSLAIHTYTGPSTTAPGQIRCPASINNQQDLDASQEAVWRDLRCNKQQDYIRQYDGVLVACYSDNPLVTELASLYPRIAVTGILEASIVATLPLVRPAADVDGFGGQWGIVTTGSFWEAHLHAAVLSFLGQHPETTNTRFRGVFTTGLNASDFHGGVDPGTVVQKLKDATKALIASQDVDCVVMGCAGMAGLEDIIRSTAVEVYGEERARRMHVVDSVRAGISVLEGMARNKRMFLPPARE